MGRLFYLLSLLLGRLAVALAVPRRRDERGDVPGWVLVTVMSAAVVALLIPVVGRELTDLLKSALNSVK